MEDSPAQNTRSHTHSSADRTNNARGRGLDRKHEQQQQQQQQQQQHKQQQQQHKQQQQQRRGRRHQWREPKSVTKSAARNRKLRYNAERPTAHQNSIHKFNTEIEKINTLRAQHMHTPTHTSTHTTTHTSTHTTTHTSTHTTTHTTTHTSTPTRHVDDKHNNKHNRVGVVYDKRCLLHMADWKHVECPQRILTTWSALQKSGLLKRCHISKSTGARLATTDELQGTHTKRCVCVCVCV